ncbi:hypothetical protein AX766_10655 [Flavobacterium covae]|nr:hypothetical protein AX766_10655 [Flavobacterium covae]
MKKMLLIFPDYYHFDKVVLKGFKKYSDFEVIKITPNKNYYYRNFFEKILNFFSKTLFGTNLKKKYFVYKRIIKQINQHENYDFIFVNRPDILDKRHISLLHKKSNNVVALYWDSIDKIPGSKKTIPLFKKHVSFDKEDCLKYNFKFIPNFYFDIEKKEKNEKPHDIVFLGTYDKRIDDFINFYKKVKSSQIDIYAKIFDKKKEINPKNQIEGIEFTNKIIPFINSSKFYKNCHAILDLAHKNQRGLSFRPYEALGLKIKLITNNTDIVNYDFYHPNNIFVFEEINTDELIKFLKLPYHELSTEIYLKYSQKKWIDNILNY